MTSINIAEILQIIANAEWRVPDEEDRYGIAGASDAALIAEDEEFGLSYVLDGDVFSILSEDGERVYKLGVLTTSAWLTHDDQVRLNVKPA